MLQDPTFVLTSDGWLSISLRAFEAVFMRRDEAACLVALRVCPINPPRNLVGAVRMLLVLPVGIYIKYW